MTIKRLTLALLVAAACSTSDPDDPGDPMPPAGDDEPADPGPGPAAGGEDNTFDHPNAEVDVWDLLDRMTEEGPPRYSARVHSCPKLKYAALGRLLASRGVDLAAEGETSAGRMWREADQALGAPNYAARSPEALELTTASAAKLFDIFLQAAPEIVANMPSRAECTVGGVPARMFNDAGQCSPDGISCLIGVPAQPGHLELCNQMIARASTPDKGRLIAVAALAAAAHTCE